MHAFFFFSLSLSPSATHGQIDQTKCSLSLSLSTRQTQKKKKERGSTKERCSVYRKSAFFGENFDRIFFIFLPYFRFFFLKEAENVSKHRLDDARVHRRVHIPGPLGGVLSDWCVLLFFFLSLKSRRARVYLRLASIGLCVHFGFLSLCRLLASFSFIDFERYR